MGNAAKVQARQLWILNNSPRECFWASYSYFSVSIKALVKLRIIRLSFGLWNEWPVFHFIVLQWGAAICLPSAVSGRKKKNEKGKESHWSHSAVNKSTAENAKMNIYFNGNNVIYFLRHIFTCSISSDNITY